MMTFGEKLTHVAKDDPKFASSVRRIRVASWVFGVGVAFALGIGIWSVAVNYQQGTQITRIEPPCLKYGPDSDQCEEAFSAAVSTITHPQACAIERKAGTLRAIRELADAVNVTFTEPCAGARLAQERQRGNERAASARGNGSDAGGAPTSTGASPKPTTGGGSEGGTGRSPEHPGAKPDSQAPDGDDGDAGEDPADQVPAGDPEGPASTPTTDPGSDAGSTTETRRESALESAGTTAGEVAGDAGDLLETTTCGLTGPLLCPDPSRP